MKAFKNKFLIPLVAIAGTIGFSVSAQVVAIKNGNRVYIDGLSPNTNYDIGNLTSVKRRYLANQCGVILVPTNNILFPNVEINGVNPILSGAVDLSAAPRCINGQLDIPPTDNFRLPSGQIGLINQVPNLAIEIDISGVRNRNFRSNACGIIQIAAPINLGLPVGTITVNDSGYQLQNTATPICLNGVRYLSDSEYPL